MILFDTACNRIVCDIAPGDIGPGARLVFDFGGGRTALRLAPPAAVAAWAWAERLLAYCRQRLVPGAGKGWTRLKEA